jgi:hypothetical protein
MTLLTNNMEMDGQNFQLFLKWRCHYVNNGRSPDTCVSFNCFTIRHGCYYFRTMGRGYFGGRGKRQRQGRCMRNGCHHPSGVITVCILAPIGETKVPSCFKTTHKDGNRPPGQHMAILRQKELFDTQTLRCYSRLPRQMAGSTVPFNR